MCSKFWSTVSQVPTQPACQSHRAHHIDWASTTRCVTLCLFSSYPSQLVARDSSSLGSHWTRSCIWTPSTFLEIRRISPWPHQFPSTFVLRFCLPPSSDGSLWFLWRCSIANHPTSVLLSWWCNQARDEALASRWQDCRGAFPFCSARRIPVANGLKLASDCSSAWNRPSFVARNHFQVCQGMMVISQLSLF